MAPRPAPDVSKLLQTLERGLRGDEIETYQQQRLIDIARYARGATSYYEAGLDAFLARGSFDPISWSSIPILTRDVVRARRNDLMAAPQAMPADAGPVRGSTTSGTSGEPLEFRINRLADIFSQLRYRAHFTDWDIKITGRVLTVRNPKKKEFASAGQIVEKRHPRGGTEVTLFSLAIDKVLEAITTVRPNYLRTFPGVVFQCAAEARRRNLSLSLDRVMTVGETLDADTQAFIEQTCSCKVADAYATTEFGLIACGCPKCGNYHVSHEGLFVELLDAAGRAVSPGEAGRVVVTSLYNYAMPLIRYELSDYATRSTSAGACGQRGLSIGRVMGRRRGMFRLPRGGLIWPHVPVTTLHDLGVTAYRVTQTELEHVKVQYEGASMVPPGAIIDLVHRFVSPDYTVTVERVESFAALPSGKHLVYESLVEEAS